MTRTCTQGWRWAAAIDIIGQSTRICSPLAGNKPVHRRCDASAIPDQFTASQQYDAFLSALCRHQPRALILEYLRSALQAAVQCTHVPVQAATTATTATTDRTNGTDETREARDLLAVLGDTR